MRKQNIMGKYNPLLQLFYNIMRIILYPVYLVGKILNMITSLAVPAFALLYLVFIIYDIYTIIRDGFVFPSDIILPIGVGIILMFICAILGLISNFLSVAFTIPINGYYLFVKKCRDQRIYKDVYETNLQRIREHNLHVGQYIANHAKIPSYDVPQIEAEIYCDDPHI